MEQGDGYCDDVCPCEGCREGLVLHFRADDPVQAVLQGMIDSRDRAIDDLIGIAGYLPEAYAILAKYGLR